jgi:release factor glutamine methyltransferase
VDPDAAGRVTLAGGSWYGALPPGLAGRVDLVVANPPYVTADEYLGLEPVVRSWEPRSALVAARGRCGVDGTADVEAVVEGAPRWLRPGGSLVVELAPHQAYAAIDVARRAGFRQVAVERDLAGRLRVLVASR